jgi:hypothetical protein
VPLYVEDFVNGVTLTDKKIMREREEVTLDKICKKVVEADRDEQESPRLGKSKAEGIRVPRKQVHRR